MKVEPLNKDELNRLAKWRVRLERRFWTETDESLFLKILGLNDAVINIRDKDIIFPEANEQKFMDKDLKEFYKKKGYKIG